MARLLSRALALAALVGLAACQPPLEWYKEGVTPSDYAADQTYCKGAEDMVPAYTPDDEMYLVHLRMIETYNKCMKSRGYRLVEPGSEPK